MLSLQAESWIFSKISFYITFFLLKVMDPDWAKAFIIKRVSGSAIPRRLTKAWSYDEDGVGCSVSYIYNSSNLVSFESFASWTSLYNFPYPHGWVQTACNYFIVIQIVIFICFILVMFMFNICYLLVMRSHYKMISWLNQIQLPYGFVVCL